MSLGRYSEEVRQLLKKGSTAAKRLNKMDQSLLRSALLALVPRMEVNTSGLKLYVSCFELSHFLAWDGLGVFGKCPIKPLRVRDIVHIVQAPAFLICRHARFALPISSGPRRRHAETLARGCWIGPPNFAPSCCRTGIGRFPSLRSKSGWGRATSPAFCVSTIWRPISRLRSSTAPTPKG